MKHQVTRVRVTERNSEADDVLGLTLEAVDGSPLPPWKPGAHIDLVLSPDLVRQYSLCGDPKSASQYKIAVLHERNGRGGSRFIFKELCIGKELSIRGPKSNFPLKLSQRYIFIAGGIGITPLLPMINEVSKSGADWTLIYCGRSRRSMAFVNELQHFGEKITLVPFDEVGFADFASLLKSVKPNTLVYCCGPSGLLEAVERNMHEWPKGSLHVERFSPIPVDSEEHLECFELVLQRSNKTVLVPHDKSILEVVAELGIPTLSACGEGTCGTCETRIIAGKPLHRDSLLDEDEKAAGEYMLICVSRSRTKRLVLDL